MRYPFNFWQLHILFLLAMVHFPSASNATNIVVSPTDSWSTISSKLTGANAGDDVALAPGTYFAKGTIYLQANASGTAVVKIHAQDYSNPPIWDGAAVATRDCWQVAGTSPYEITGIVFQNWPNGAGVRAVNGPSLTIRGCEFRNGTQGITGAADLFTIENNHLHDNSDHSVYIYGGGLVMRFNYIHDCKKQNLHNRAVNAVIEYNWFARPGIYNLDLMGCDNLCGGNNSSLITQKMLLRGNIIENAGAANHSQIFPIWRDEANQDGTGTVNNFDLTMVYNTVIGFSNANLNFIHIVNDAGVTFKVELDNNVLHSLNNLDLIDNSDTNWSISGTNNWLTTGTAGDTQLLANTFSGSDPGFVNTNLAGQNLAPASGSALVGHAKTALANASVPALEYYQNESNPLQYRTRISAQDIGAFEHNTAGVGCSWIACGVPPPTSIPPMTSNDGPGNSGKSATGNSSGSFSANSTANDAAGKSGGCILVSTPDAHQPWMELLLTTAALFGLILWKRQTTVE